MYVIFYPSIGDVHGVASYVRIDDWLDIVNNKERKEKKRVTINKVIRQVASELVFCQSIDREVR
jgi:hypothetical protein